MKIADAFPNTMTGTGFFDLMFSRGVPWTQSANASMDFEYFNGYSGNKETSPVIDRIIGSNTVLTGQQVIALANIVYDKYANSWRRLYQALTAVYNPINNYDMTETEAMDGTISRQNTDTRTDNLTQGSTQDITRTGNGSSAGNTGVHGFNSVDAVPSDTNSGTVTNSETTRGGDTVTNTGTVTNAGSGVDAEHNTRTLTRSGNIGVTTSQQMIESEIALRENNFYNIVYGNIDSVLCCHTY